MHGPTVSMAWTNSNPVPRSASYSSLSSALLDGRSIPEVFPTSTRRALLIQKIQQQKQQQEQQPTTSSSTTKGSTTKGSSKSSVAATTPIANSYYSYGQPGWSNRFGTVLTPAAIPGVYTADRPFLWNSIDVGCRMTLIELESGGLWVHSPVALDGPLFQLLQSWNQPVKYIVSPNYEHVKFANQWYQAFPQAEMWACPGLAERLPQISWAGEIPYGHRPAGFFPNNNNAPASSSSVRMEWEPEIQALHVDTEVNPFTGKPFFNECIFYHTPSQTLMTTDLFWNYPPRTRRSDDDPVLIPPIDAVPWTTSLWKFGMDQVFHPFYMQLMTQDKERLEQIGQFLVNDDDGASSSSSSNSSWKVETLIPAHGDVLRESSKITSVLRQHFNLN